RALPADDFAFRKRPFGDEVLVQLGDLNRRVEPGAVQLRAIELRGSAGGRVCVDDGLGVLADLETFEVARVIAFERLTLPSPAAAIVALRIQRGLLAAARGEQRRKASRHSLQGEVNAVRPIEIHLLALSTGQVVVVDDVDAGSDETRIGGKR